MADRATRKVSFVTTNFNGRRNLERCLPHIIEAASRGGHCNEVIVVDDCSTDDSLEFLAREYPDVRVIALSKRSSFLGAANEGFRQARNPIVALLSNDMAPDPDFLERLLPHMEAPDVFAAHGTLVSPEGELDVQRKVGRFLFGNFKIVNTARGKKGLGRLLVPWGAKSHYSLYTGAYGLFDREKFLELGGLDAMYLPFYWEDVDLCYRAWRRGWKTIAVPECRVTHFHEELSTIRNNFRRHYIRNIERRNGFLFLWSNIDSPLHLLGHMLYLLMATVFSPVFGRLGFYSSLYESLRRLPQVLERRRQRTEAAWSDQEIFDAVLYGRLPEQPVSSPAMLRLARSPEAVAGFGVARPLTRG